MNERIKELAEQAGIRFSPMIVDGEEYDYTEVSINPDNIGDDESDCIEKFAELIVRECISILYTERESPHGSERDFAIVNAALKIQRHFEGE